MQPGGGEPQAPGMAPLIGFANDWRLKGNFGLRMLSQSMALGASGGKGILVMGYLRGQADLLACRRPINAIKAPLRSCNWILATQFASCQNETRLTVGGNVTGSNNHK